MATSLLPSLAAESTRLRSHESSYTKLSSFGKMSSNAVVMKSKNHRLSVCAEYRTGGRGGGGGGEFVAGFVLGGAVFGALAYVFAPQIRRSLLNEDEYGFRKARRPIYYDEDDDGLEKTRQTLNAKLGQLNAAIDNVSSRLRGGSKASPVSIESDPEVEATI